jgi:hypothetical protein
MGNRPFDEIRKDMRRWFKKPVVEFICRIEGVQEMMPIIPAKDLKHPWVLRALNDLAEKRKAVDGVFLEKTAHISKCPGIFTMMRHGWVLRSWLDISIETYGDGVSCAWATPINQRDALGVDAVEIRPRNELTQFLGAWDGAIDGTIKFNTPWDCKVPDGYMLLEMPLSYGDDARFEVLPGFILPEYGLISLSPQVKWKVAHGKTLIKAGTPLAQYIPIKKEKIGMVMTTSLADRDKKVRDILLTNTFSNATKQLKDFYRGEKI